MVRVSLDNEKSRWRWFKYSSAEVELFCPTAQELSRVLAQFGLAKSDADHAGFSAFLAERWFRAFRGIVDTESGKPIENTKENRVKLLDQVPGLGQWVQSRLVDFAAWLDEGNADSGSA